MIDICLEVEGINIEVFILNIEIIIEEGINVLISDFVIDVYFDIINDFNIDKLMFINSFFIFIVFINKVVIYVRVLNVVDSSNEVFFDNVKIVESE